MTSHFRNNCIVCAKFRWLGSFDQILDPPLQMTIPDLVETSVHECDISFVQTHFQAPDTRRSTWMGLSPNPSPRPPTRKFCASQQAGASASPYSDQTSAWCPTATPKLLWMRYRKLIGTRRKERSLGEVPSGRSTMWQCSIWQGG